MTLPLQSPTVPTEQTLAEDTSVCISIFYLFVLPIDCKDISCVKLRWFVSSGLVHMVFYNDSHCVHIFQRENVEPSLRFVYYGKRSSLSLQVPNPGPGNLEATMSPSWRLKSHIVVVAQAWILRKPSLYIKLHWSHAPWPWAKWVVKKPNNFLMAADFLEEGFPQNSAWVLSVCQNPPMSQNILISTNQWFPKSQKKKKKKQKLKNKELFKDKVPNQFKWFHLVFLKLLITAIAVFQNRTLQLCYLVWKSLTHQVLRWLRELHGTNVLIKP